MDWLYALGCVVAVVAVALLLGWSQKLRPVPQTAIWIASILVLLALWYGPEKSWELCFILVVLGLYWLDHVPPFVWGLILASVVLLFLEYRYRVMAARISRLENSVRD